VSLFLSSIDALEATIGRLFDQLEDAPLRRWDALDGVVDVLDHRVATRLIFRDAEWSERQGGRGKKRD
jgi:hypothetical protein